MNNSKLEMRNISIEFPGVKALDDVSFVTYPGKVHALLGANGAGKSTLMKVLSGAYDHYTGEIYINDEKVEINNPRDAQELGIQIVHQEVDTALVPYLSVGENLMMNFLVNDMEKKQMVNWRELHQRATEILNNLNIKISSKVLVSDLNLAEKQMVLIGRAMSRGCKYLILDEPTAPLSNKETEELYELIDDLINRNVGIIFISHRLPEIFAICDEITIMKDGKFVIKELIPNLTENKIIEYMLGKKLENQFPDYDFEKGETIFETRNLSDKETIKDINIKVREGEIVGIAGLVGAGKTEVCKAIFGCSPLTEGSVIKSGKTLKLNTPYDSVENGIAMIPEERRKEGVSIDDSVQMNLTSANIKRFSNKFGFMLKAKEKTISSNLVKDLSIKTPSINSLVRNLSGGNQQKVAIGKWLASESDIFIFDEPTKGVDVGAKRDIYDLIVQLAQDKKGIIYATSEFSEILGLTDRVYVVYDGQIVKEVVTKETSESELLLYSTGGGRGE